MAPTVRPLLTPPRTSCPTATLVRALLLTDLLWCGIASVHSNCCTTVACAHRPAAAAAPDAGAGPFPLSDLIRLARAAACSTAVSQLPSAASVRQAVDVIVADLACIRSAVNLRRKTDRRGGSPNAPNMGATTLPPLLTSFTPRGRICCPALNTSTAPVQQLADKIRAAGQTCTRALKFFESTTT
jgi:hypothetical protein